MKAPGWYPNPDNPTAHRYWDGRRWNLPLEPDLHDEDVRRSRMFVVVPLMVLLVIAAAVVTQVMLLSPSLNS
jgi:hypothetical protein